MIFAALDFETANNDKISACSLGIVILDENLNVINKYYSLIRPPELRFCPICSQIHGLSEEEITAAPTFDTLWPRIQELLGTYPIVAHNAGFDVNVLKSLIDHYSLKTINFDYYCTFQMSRKLMPNMPSYKLSYIMNEEFKLKYKEHDAYEDALCCGILFTHLLKLNIAKCKTYPKKIYTKKDNRKPLILAPKQK